jgi:hypothetical protein
MGMHPRRNTTGALELSENRSERGCIVGHCLRWATRSVGAFRMLVPQQRRGGVR